MPSLASLKNQLVEVFTTKKTLTYIVLAVLFVLVAVYTYRSYIKPGIYEGYKANNEFKHEGSGKGGAELYFFYTNWCPHCKTAKPIWQDFKDTMGNKEIKGRKITYLEVDCEADPATAETFNVKGYPTIKLVKDDQVIEYDAKPDKDTLMEFLETSL